MSNILSKENEINTNDVRSVSNFIRWKEEEVNILTVSGKEMYHISKQNTDERIVFTNNIFLSSFQFLSATFWTLGGLDDFKKSLTLLPI